MTNNDMDTQVTPEMRRLLTRLIAAVDVMVAHCHTTVADWRAAQYDAQFWPAETIERHVRQAESIATRLTS